MELKYLTSSSSIVFTGRALLLPKCCVYNAERLVRASLSNGHVLHEWKTLCATINGQVESQVTKPKSLKEAVDLISRLNKVDQGNGGGDADKVVDGLSFLQVGNLVPSTQRSELAALNLPRPLSISCGQVSDTLRGTSIRVAYQGVPGAYSEAAAAKAYPNCETVPCDQFEVAFQSVELWIAERAVLPVENSLGGSIHRNYDLLLRHHLHIVGEVQLPVKHCLLALPGVRLSDIRRVISHPQALSQCENTLTRLGLQAAREAVDDTAGAAQFIAENGIRDTAAIASSRAAQIYGMNVLAEGIQDDCNNVTRFVMLAREPIIPKLDRPFKTSIVFATEGTTGSLFKVLSAFAFRNINLTKIESRPQRRKAAGGVCNIKKRCFEYLYYIDFEASMADQRAQNAMREVQEFTSFLRVLGSYPMDMAP
ncbi:hypothetical protein KP509_37G054900 [Ceratopteris richardii]|uniref:Arogenate dehydratase n=1 Tax=Ceratopteris richardii TaxID=49495 RepID=A0A8T2Q8V7_CERRI|nr:hypothetical protein KP509_37G054900 [Ceratopteris richardii]